MPATVGETVRDVAQPISRRPEGHPGGRIRQSLGWIAVAGAAAAAIIIPLAGLLAAAQAVSLCALALAVVQGPRRYGWKLFLAFFATCFVISNFWENLSIITGFPFGNYYYTLMPQLFYVPVIVGVIYFGIGWVSWMTTNAVLDRADERLDLRTRAGRVNVIALPALSGAVMTMFDVGADSLISTVRSIWIWEDGGGVFGVPFTNYLGWWFVTWTFFQVFTLMLAARQTRRPARPARPLRQVSHLQPVLTYAMFTVVSMTTFIAGGGPQTVVDPSGASWDTAALNETLMIIDIFSVVPVALFAIAKIARGDLKRA
ncbi:carotenoid biosynthesis protein [Arthrobacter sp. B0490]|uniref:carotenoid biosynthesis protein n=1 Tax=Arthrobacter sp. B0490 TaxID=2058891 RepID=UPI000CE5220F|nr:carotenoid biosynthesis protein [Arthrobacter sp. B0490]